MRHPPDPARGAREAWYAIHEVYYSNDDVDDRLVDVSETGYTEQPVAIRGEHLEDLRWMLEQMLKALEKPMLDYQE
jgi:hypothetical protein